MSLLVKSYLQDHSICNSPDKFSPWSLTLPDLLEERRTRLRVDLCQLLISGKRGNCKCGWGKTYSGKYGLLLVEYMPIKMLEVPMADIITNMEQVSTEDMERTYCGDRSSYRIYYHEPLPYSETLLGKLDTMKKKASICIDCVRSIGAAKV